MSARSPGTGLRRLALLVFLLISLAATLAPLAWMVATAVRPVDELAGPAASLLPGRLTSENFTRLFALIDLPRHFGNSLVYAGGLTLLSLVFNTLAGFAFARFCFPGRDRLFTLLLLTMMIPSQITLIPTFLVLEALGLLNSYAGLIIPGAAHVFGIFMVRQFVLELPQQVFEAARIDGCDEFGMFWHIGLPLCRPVLATLTVITFVNTWNEFMWPLIVMQREEAYTLPVALAVLAGQQGDPGLIAAGALLVIAPTVLVFLVAQRHYLAGIAAGSGR